MSELKSCIMALGFFDVTTYLNSGNIIFSSDETEETILAYQIQSAIQERFHMDIPVLVIGQEELVDMLNHAPDWWGTEDKEIYDNLIFIMPPLLYTEFCGEIGQPKEEYEQVHPYKNAIFWSFSRKNYQKTNWWSKTATYFLWMALPDGLFWAWFLCAIRNCRRSMINCCNGRMKRRA